ncbi:hypothetical protein K435DRAFT_796577 [Dendrothele bispora CBS 962.96]|uniref:Uncharacterized protein n=1 Tax=Dendrothele bispora (strain CBS 962.96) TaxID=1314807 RepID=A0A4S8M6H0_DENBC|nr:hypothetical protein K435DRAFT_796577 [Dendrothele bispora CBS 962.96]
MNNMNGIRSYQGLRKRDEYGYFSQTLKESTLNTFTRQNFPGALGLLRRVEVFLRHTMKNMAGAIKASGSVIYNEQHDLYGSYKNLRNCVLHSQTIYKVVRSVKCSGNRSVNLYKGSICNQNYLQKPKKKTEDDMLPLQEALQKQEIERRLWSPNALVSIIVGSNETPYYLRQILGPCPYEKILQYEVDEVSSSLILQGTNAPLNRTDWKPGVALDAVEEALTITSLAVRVWSLTETVLPWTRVTTLMRYFGSGLQCECNNESDYY